MCWHIFFIYKMEVLLDVPRTLKPLITSYLDPYDVEQIYEDASDTHLIYAESAEFDMDTEDLDTALARYDRRTLKSVGLYGFDPNLHRLSALIPLKLRSLTLYNLYEQVNGIKSRKLKQFLNDLQSIGLTLNELRIMGYTDDPDLLNTIQFPRLTKLILDEWYTIQAPKLKALEVGEGKVDISNVVALYPHLTQLELRESITNPDLLSRLPLTHLTLSDAGHTVDLTHIPLIHLTLHNSDVKAFPKTLRHLFWSNASIDLAKLKSLRLETLDLTTYTLERQPFIHIRTKYLRALTLHHFELTDTLFIDSSYLTELNLSDCRVTYTELLEAPRLAKVFLYQCECTDFLPASVIDLSLFEVTGDIVRSLKFLNLKRLFITKTLFRLRHLKGMQLTDLTVHHCNLTILKYIRDMSTLRSLDLSDNPLTDAVIPDLLGLNLRILKLLRTDITQEGFDVLTTMHLQVFEASTNVPLQYVPRLF